MVGDAKMKIAMPALTLVAAMSVSSNAATSQGLGGFSPEVAYGACQEDALRGVHYGLEGDCPNWDAWKAGHMQFQTLPHQHVYPRSRAGSHLKSRGF
jgi:hypothetical protein